MVLASELYDNAEQDRRSGDLYNVPFAAWPDYKGGYVVLDLRTTHPVAGPYHSIAAVMAEMDRLNREFLR